MGLGRAESDASLDNASPSSVSASNTERRRRSSLKSVPLVVPPEGVEEEAEEKEFHSCSEDEDEEQSSPHSNQSSEAGEAAKDGTGTLAGRSEEGFVEREAKPSPAKSSSNRDAPTLGTFKDRLADFPRGRGSHQWESL